MDGRVALRREHTYKDGASTAVVVDDDPVRIVSLTRMLDGCGLRVRAFDDIGVAAQGLNATSPPALIIVSLALRGSDGLGFCRLLRAPPFAAFHDVPLLLVSLRQRDRDISRLAAEAGADGVLPWPSSSKQVADIVSALLAGEQVFEVSRALIVDGSMSRAAGAASSLREEGWDVIVARSGDEALALDEAAAFDVVVIDQRVEGFDKGELLIELVRRWPGSAPVVTAEEFSTLPVQDLVAKGAAAWLERPFTPEDLTRLCDRLAREGSLQAVERQLAESAREAQFAEKRYEVLAEGSLQAVVIGQDNPMRIVFANEAISALLERSVDEILAMGPAQLVELVHPNDRERFLDIGRRRLAGDDVPQHGLYRMLRATGEFVWVKSYSARIEYQGEPCTLTTFVDISDVKRLESEALRTARFSEALLDAIPTPVFFKDRLGRYIGCNRAFTELMGVTSEEIAGKTVQELWPSEQAETYHRTDLELMKSGEHQVYDFEVKDKSGEIRPVVFAKSVFRDHEGEVAGIVGAFLDIAERKRLEDELRRSEAKYREMAELMPQVLWEMDLEGRFTYINRAGYQIYGYSPEELERGLFFTWVLAEEEHERARVNLGKQPGDPSRIGSNEYMSVTRDGRCFPVLIYSSLVIEEGKPVGVRGITLDISERSRLEQERASLEEQLRFSQKMEAVGRLAGGVAHDFNNVLCAIAGNTELALDEVEESDSLRESLEEISRAADRAAELIKQLLAFSRKQVVEPKVIDLSGQLEGLRPMLTRLLGEDIVLRTVAQEGRAFIRVDPGQLDQVVVNLAVNARDAMPSGGELTIETSTLRVVEPGDYVMLSVSDTGVGMTPEIRSKIFEPFFTTKEVGKGTGLGLATVYGIVEQSRGRPLSLSPRGVMSRSICS